jgi:hypothetical protein
LLGALRMLCMLLGHGAERSNPVLGRRHACPPSRIRPEQPLKRRSDHGTLPDPSLMGRRGLHAQASHGAPMRPRRCPSLEGTGRALGSSRS